mmetsp:Transcript_8822/g.54276  ORF Transcript_8822/g.54276 Transcript_8822/m.54276 type:complete len:180 (+) Transcript_8822:362-901(+)
MPERRKLWLSCSGASAHPLSQLHQVQNGMHRIHLTVFPQSALLQDIVLVFGSSLSRPQLLIQLRYLGLPNEIHRTLKTNAQVLSKKLVREIVAETATGELPMPTKMFLAILSPESVQCPSGFWPKRVESLKFQKAKRRIALNLPTEDGQLCHGDHQCASEAKERASFLYICKTQLKAFT